MAGSESPSGPDPDNWFDEPDVSDVWQIRADRLARSRRAAPPGAESDDWLTEPRRQRARTTTEARRPVAVAGLVALAAVLLGGLLAAAGAFSGGHAPSPITLQTAHPPPAATTPAPTTSQPSLTVPTATLQVGAQGAAVGQLQRVLVLLGYSPGTVDGRYGPSTEAAVRRFQQAHGLVADGIAGNATLTALKAALP